MTSITEEGIRTVGRIEKICLASGFFVGVAVYIFLRDFLRFQNLLWPTREPGLLWVVVSVLFVALFLHLAWYLAKKLIRNVKDTDCAKLLATLEVRVYTQGIMGVVVGFDFARWIFLFFLKGFLPGWDEVSCFVVTVLIFGVVIKKQPIVVRPTQITGEEEDDEEMQQPLTFAVPL